MEIHYEHLTADPATVLAGICDFLAVPYDERILNSSMHYMDEAVAEKAAGRIVKNSGKWQTYFDEATRQNLERIAGRTLIELGYPAQLAGDEEPDELTRSLWILRDRIGFTLHFFNEYGLGAAPIFARHIVTAAKQWTSARF